MPNVSDVANGYHLITAGSGSPNITYDRLAPVMDFVRANTNYLYHPDCSHFDVIGNESHVTYSGLTFGGWFNFDSFAATASEGLISKWYETGNQRAYRIYRSTNTGAISVQVSGDGAAVDTTTIAGATYGIANDNWYFIVGRFRPGKELKLWVNTTIASYTATSIPAAATIYNSTEPFEIGRTNRANYFDGQAALCFVAASIVPDYLIWSLWQHSRWLFK